MRIRRIPLVIALGVITAVAAVALVPELGGVADGRRATAVKLGDNFFKPARKVVRRGTVVRFFWAGRNPHNVTKARGPGRRFRSKTTSRRGVNFAKRFRKRGVYLLVCTIHPRTMRMKLGVRR